MAILAGLFIGLGGAFDKLLTFRLKVRIHTLLVHWWNRLDETPIPDLFARVAAWIVNRVDCIATKPHFWFLLYLFATIAFITIGMMGILVTDAQKIYTIPVPALAAVKPDSVFDKTNLPHILTCAAAFPFDFAILILTTAILRRVRLGLTLRNMALILTHVLATILATAGCFAAVIWATNYAFNNSLLGMQYQRRVEQVVEVPRFNYLFAHDPGVRSFWLTNENFFLGRIPLSKNAFVTKMVIVNSYLDELCRVPKTFAQFLLKGRANWSDTYYVEVRDGDHTLSYTHTDNYYLGKTALLLTGTVCLPVLGLFSFLTILVIAKVVLNLARSAAMYFLDLTTENNPKEFAPGALVGVVFGVVLTLANCVAEVIKLFGSSGKP